MPGVACEAHLDVVFGVYPLRKDAGAAVIRLDPEGALRDPHALLAADARALILRRVQPLVRW